jgi:spore coat protein U-like protein
MKTMAGDHMRHDWNGFFNFIVVVCLVLLPYSQAHANGGCRVSTTPIYFGSYDILSSVNNTSTGTIVLSCSPKADVTIGISFSSNSGSYNSRKMQHNGLSDTLEYNLYTNANRTHVWGDGHSGTSDAHFSNVKTDNIPPIIIYGSITAQQNVSTGIYSDQLVVTISY